MCYFDFLVIFYKASTLYELEKCAENIYTSYYVDGEVNKKGHEILCHKIEQQSNRILYFLTDPDTYKTLDKRYIDEEGHIVFRRELKEIYDSFTDEEKAEHNNSFDDYMQDCMAHNGGTLTRIL